METFWQKIAEILFLSKLEKRWRKIAKALAVVVVFCTTYMLILPAITMENDVYCGLEEHIHSDSCYVIESILICGYEADSLEENEELTSDTEEGSTAEETTAEETITEETTTEETTTEETTTEETTTEETTTEETTTEEITTEEITTEEITTEEITTEEITTEETTTEEITSEVTEPSVEIHIHTEECYEYKKTLTCTNVEHSHEDICFIEVPAKDIEMHSIDTSGDEYGVDAQATTATEFVTVDFSELDGTGDTSYIVYACYGDKYYAFNGTGQAVQITVTDGVVSGNNISDLLYWNFTKQSGTNVYKIINVNNGRCMHTYSNSGTDIGVTTQNAYDSTLVPTTIDGVTTFAVYCNGEDYTQITSSNGRITYSRSDSLSSAAQFYIAQIPPDRYHVWFDGTCGGLMSLYESPNTYLSVPGDRNTIILPAEWDSPSKYSYTLNGWYDIKNHVYYEPGATATITKNTVFYADWVANTYDVGIVNDENVGLIAPSLDTNTFIRTDMFDYSAVFNMQAVTHTGSVSASSHSETWTIVQNSNVPYNNVPSLGFTFRDWDTGNINISYGANRARLNDNIGTEITSGIVDYVYDMSGKDIIDILFNPETDVIGKNHVGQANYLYQFMEDGSENYDGEHNGYYYYDSRYNAASYNQTNGRFYIYNYLERTSDSLKDSCDSNGIKTKEGGYSDFLPFNSPYVNNHNNKKIVRYADGDGVADNYQYDAKATNQSSDIANAGTNYWFGMKSEIQFYLPDDTGTVDAYQNYGNISSHGKHMTFEFSGDDDLWVFIDGEPVMDIGGLHGIMEGKIDFSTGVITTSKAAGISAGSSAGSGVAVTDSLDLEAGDHTLTVYYMERGGSQSNCAIYFNITPRYGMELIKKDSVDGKGLNGAKFGVYTDIGCTKPAALWSSETAHQNGEKSTNEFTAINGKVSFWGVSAGKVYYLKELVAPKGYPLTDDIIRISMNSLGSSICSADALRGDDGMHTDGFEIINNSADEAHQQIAITLTNQKYTTNKRNIAVTKHWSVEDESLLPESVTIYLLANGQNTGRYAVLSDLNNWTYLWIDLPIYDSVGAKIEYSIYEEQAEDFYTDVEVEEEQTINAWVQTDTLYDGGTFLIVNRKTGYALTVNSSGNFVWVDKQSAETDESAHWIVNADGMGFHVINVSGYHIILDGTDEFVPDKNGNRILYYNNFGLAAKYNNTYYYLNDNFSASTKNSLDLELYINMDILIHEEDGTEEDGGEKDPEEDTQQDDEIFVTMYNVTNTYIEEERQTSFEVEKKWDDNATSHIHDSITVRLYADGVDTGRRLILNNSNGWKGSFRGLLYEDKDGNEIEYTVIEDSFKGYSPEYSVITKEDGRTVTETVYHTETGWESATSLTSGETYRFIYGNYALATNSNNQVVRAGVSETDAYQQWTVTSSGSSWILRNARTGYYIYYNNGLTMDRTNSTAFTYSGNRLYYTSGRTTRYITLSSNTASTTTTSGSAATFTLSHYYSRLVPETVTTTVNAKYSITITNIKAYYILPETGGEGTYYLYMIGGLLVTLSAVFLLCLYKKDRGRRRRDSG